MVWCDILCFPSFLYNPRRTIQNRQGQSKSDTGRPRLAQSAVVPNISNGTNAETRPRVSEGKSTCLTNKPGSKTQTAKGKVWLYAKYEEETRELCFFSDSYMSHIMFIHIPSIAFRQLPSMLLFATFSRTFWSHSASIFSPTADCFLHAAWEVCITVCTVFQTNTSLWSPLHWCLKVKVQVFLSMQNNHRNSWQMSRQFQI